MADFDSDTPVGIVGAGTMGAGIAQVAALGGHHIRIHDTIPGAADEAIRRIQQRLARLTDKGRLDPTRARAAGDRLSVAGSVTELQDCGLIIEAVAEDLTAKRETFSTLEAVCPPETILATNTSSLSVTDVAANLEHPNRVAGLHFFNPAPLLPLVEVVHGEASDKEVIDTLIGAVRAWGKTPVQCASTPGFIVNRVARPYYAEAFRLLSAQLVDPATLDAVLCESGGFPLGPCELTDMIGQDVNAAVTRSVWEAFGRDPRFEPSELQTSMVAEGRLGHKAGGGFYEGTSRPGPATAEQCPYPDHVDVHGSGDPLEALVERLEKAGISVHRSEGEGHVRIRPADGVVLQLTDGRTAAEVSNETGETIVLVDLALDFGGATRLAVAPPPHAPPDAVAAAVGCVQASGATVTVLSDTPGLVVGRTVAMLASFAADTVDAGVASAEDVDTAMRLGVNYPLGPLAWGDRLGWPWVASMLRALAASEDPQRYRLLDGLRDRAGLEEPAADGDVQAPASNGG